MHKPSNFRDYVIAGLIAVSLLVFFGFYLYIRRGYMFDAPPTADTLYVPNKVIAGAGTTMLALTLLIGPITRYFDRFDNWLGYRKEIGIVAALLIISHAIISYFFLPLKFPREYMSLASLEFGAGLIGAILLTLLVIISFKKVIDWIGPLRWWFLQRWGLRLVILFTVFHVFTMKWGGWMRWLNQGGGKPTAELANPWMPGLGILVIMFFSWAVIVRVYESAFLFKSPGVSTKEIAQDVKLRTHSRRFFLTSFWILIIAYIFVVTRWI